MAYVIPTKRSSKAKQVQINEFPALCKAAVPVQALDFTALSFVDEPEVIPERRFEPGWARLSYKGLILHIETDYMPPEPTLNALANTAILKMKARWIKHYTDRGEIPYDYDYVPPEPEEEEWSETTSEYDSPEYESE
jgi:hypothetical protein